MTYRFPAGDFEAAADHGDKLGFDLPGTNTRVWVPRSALTKVTPPLPTEPPVGSFVNAGSTVLHRRDSAGIDWWDLINQCWLTWAQVCDLGTPVLLVPAPAPAALPWSGTSLYGIGLTVRLGDPINVEVGGALASLGPDMARKFARALNTAADEADQAAHNAGRDD